MPPRESNICPWQPIGHRFLIPLRATPSWFWVGSGLPPQNFGSTCLQVSLRMTHKFFMKHNFFIPDRRGRRSLQTLHRGEFGSRRGGFSWQRATTGRPYRIEPVGSRRVSLRLGHARVLICHWHIIHFPRVASLPAGLRQLLCRLRFALKKHRPHQRTALCIPDFFPKTFLSKKVLEGVRGNLLPKRFPRKTPPQKSRPITLLPHTRRGSRRGRGRSFVASYGARFRDRRGWDRDRAGA